jgi:subtilisin-like proprotein convertase family protein
MKTQLLFGCFAAAAMSAQGALYNYSGSAYAIPDGNPNGVSSTIAVSGAGSSLVDITVNLNVSGGYNGDLYAYLSYNGMAVTLLNRVGEGTINGGTSFGSSGTGFIVTLTSSGPDVHWANAGGGVLTGTFQADGRAISPLSPPSSFNADGTATLDGTFQNLDPNGTWTLFFGDISSGGGTATLDSWSLGITTVPEPMNQALIAFGTIACLFGLVRSRKHMRRG